MDNKLRLAQILKQLLADRGMSLRQLSKAVGIPESTLSGYLSKAEPSKLDHVLKLSRHFEVSMEELLYGSQGPAPSLENTITELLFKGWLKVTVEKAIPDRRKTDLD